jgi:hypothetical protein
MNVNKCLNFELKDWDGFYDWNQADKVWIMGSDIVLLRFEKEKSIRFYKRVQ